MSQLARSTANNAVPGIPNPEHRGFVREIMRAAQQEILDAETTEALGTGQSRASISRAGLATGPARTVGPLITCVGELELRKMQDREHRFSTKLSERYEHSERAVVPALAERYVQRVSTRAAATITEELCGLGDQQAMVRSEYIGTGIGHWRSGGSRGDKTLISSASRRNTLAEPASAQRAVSRSRGAGPKRRAAASTTRRSPDCW
jgi:transposase-like protein